MCLVRPKASKQRVCRSHLSQVSARTVLHSLLLRIGRHRLGVVPGQRVVGCAAQIIELGNVAQPIVVHRAEVGVGTKYLFPPGIDRVVLGLGRRKLRPEPGLPVLLCACGGGIVLQNNRYRGRSAQNSGDESDDAPAIGVGIFLGIGTISPPLLSTAGGRAEDGRHDWFGCKERMRGGAWRGGAGLALGRFDTYALTFFLICQYVKEGISVKT